MAEVKKTMVEEKPLPLQDPQPYTEEEMEGVRRNGRFNTGLALTGAIAAVGFGMYRVSTLQSAPPTQVYVQDVSGDGIDDIITTSPKGGWKHVFIGQEDGSYRLLDDVLAEKRDMLKAELETSKAGSELLLENYKSSIEEKVQGLE